MSQNPHLLDLHRRMTNRYSRDALEMSMSDWICLNTTLNGKKFSFDGGYEFQRQIVDDMHPNLCCTKISQVGLTEVQIRKALAFLARYRGTKLIFTLPDSDLKDRVSKSRVRPIVDRDKAFNPDSFQRMTRSNDMMQFGDSWLYMTGDSEKDATSTSADAVFNDEVDLSDQKMLALFNSRLQNSDWKLSQRFSTPTFPSFGISADFDISDQHIDMIKCECCGHYNIPKFSHEFIHLPGLPDVEDLTKIEQHMQDLLDFENAYLKCEKCHKPLDYKNPELHSYVPKFPGRSLSRGYKISPFTSGRLDIKYIFNQLFKYQKNEFLRGFHNTVLGEAYSDNSIQLSVQEISKCFDPEGRQVPDIDPTAPVCVGIDVGQTCHIILGKGWTSETVDPFNFVTCHVDDLVDRVEEICHKYNVVAGCIDRHPYEPTADEVFKKSGGKILPVEYRGTKEINIVKTPLQDVSHAQVERTKFIDNVVKQIRKRPFTMAGYGDQKSIIISHLRDMIRDETPDKPATWVKLTNNDHYFHAMALLLGAPNVGEVVALMQEQDMRIMTSVMVGNMGSMAENMVGVGKKRFENPRLRR